MKKFYTMPECFAACGVDDVPYIEDGYNDTLKATKREILSGNEVFSMYPEYGISDQWQIKRAEPVVLTDRELYAKCLGREKPSPSGFELLLIKESRKNGQLKRDKQIREWLERNPGDTEWILKNIPQLED